MPTTSPARVRVVIVNFRSEDDVAARLASPALAHADVLVVDNASNPSRIRDVCQQYGATAVALPDNRGFAAGVNAGVAAARGRDPLPWLLLNPDAQLEPQALEALLDSLPQHDGVGPLLEEAPGRAQVGVGGGPLTLWSVTVYFLFLSHLFGRARGVFLTRAQAERGGRVAWVCMAALLLAPDAFDRYGPIPEDEVVYAEDVAWGTSASRRGARFAVVPAAVVHHPHGSSGASSEWVGALERLLRRRLGPFRGRLAVAVMRLGLASRRVVRRDGRVSGC